MFRFLFPFKKMFNATNNSMWRWVQPMLLDTVEVILEQSFCQLKTTRSLGPCCLVHFHRRFKTHRKVNGEKFIPSALFKLWGDGRWWFNEWSLISLVYQPKGSREFPKQLNVPLWSFRALKSIDRDLIICNSMQNDESLGFISVISVRCQNLNIQFILRASPRIVSCREMRQCKNVSAQ